jgi:hypothetical protein
MSDERDECDESDSSPESNERNEVMKSTGSGEVLLRPE